MCFNFHASMHESHCHVSAGICIIHLYDRQPSEKNCRRVTTVRAMNECNLRNDTSYMFSKKPEAGRGDEAIAIPFHRSSFSLAPSKVQPT